MSSSAPHRFAYTCVHCVGVDMYVCILMTVCNSERVPWSLVLLRSQYCHIQVLTGGAALRTPHVQLAKDSHLPNFHHLHDEACNSFAAIRTEAQTVDTPERSTV